MELVSSFDYFVDLVAPGEGATIEKNDASWVFVEEPGGGLEHELHHKVVLPGGVFDVIRGKNCAAYFVFAKYYGVEMRSYRTSQGGFAAAGESGEEDDHG